MKKELDKPKNCPRIKDCDKLVSKFYFKAWCISTNWENCHWYCDWQKTLHVPFEHLQLMAVEEAVHAGQITRETHQ